MITSNKNEKHDYITLTIKESYNNSRRDCWVSLITTFLGGQKKAMSGGQSSRLSLLLRQICPDALMQCKTNTAVLMLLTFILYEMTNNSLRLTP